jgi:hypothetical protein
VLLTTVCGSSSLLAQVTVEPALTVNEFGMNMKSLTRIRFGSADSAVDGVHSAIPHIAAAAAAVNHDRHRAGLICVFS